MAPEAIVGDEHGPEVDVWSLGVIAYTCLAGSLPFFGKSHDAVFNAVCRAPLDFHRKPWPLVSHDAKMLICSMMDRDPKRRARLSDVLCTPGCCATRPEVVQRRVGPLCPPSLIARKILSFAHGSPKVCPAPPLPQHQHPPLAPQGRPKGASQRTGSPCATHQGMPPVYPRLASP